MPCLKKTLRKIDINPLGNDFWRGYSNQDQGTKLEGKYMHLEEVVSLPEFKSL